MNSVWHKVVWIIYKNWGCGSVAGLFGFATSWRSTPPNVLLIAILLFAIKGGQKSAKFSGWYRYHMPLLCVTWVCQKLNRLMLEKLTANAGWTSIEFFLLSWECLHLLNLTLSVDRLKIPPTCAYRLCSKFQIELVDPKFAKDLYPTRWHDYCHQHDMVLSDNPKLLRYMLCKACQRNAKPSPKHVKLNQLDISNGMKKPPEIISDRCWKRYQTAKQPRTINKDMTGDHHRATCVISLR